MIPATPNAEVPTALITEIGRGNEDASVIFRRHGYTDAEAIAVCMQPSF